MCDFGYLAVRVEDHYLGTSPGARVRQVSAGLGLRGRTLEPSGFLASLVLDAHVVRVYATGACACDWTVVQRRALLALAQRIASASDVTW